MNGDDLAIAFAMHCDENMLTTTQAAALADEWASALYEAAEDRREALRSYAPQLIDDEEEEA